MNIAIIGLGAISKTHIEAISKTDHVLKMVVDKDFSKIKDFNCLKSENYQDVLNNNIDVVHICTPHYLHYEMCLFFLKNNIHVLCEKPLVINSQNLLDLLDYQDVHFGVCLQNRYNKTTLKIKEFIEINGYPQNIKASLFWHRAKLYYEEKWRGIFDLSGGGVLINQALHTLDLILEFSNDLKSFDVEYKKSDFGNIESEMLLNLKFNNSQAILEASVNNIKDDPIKMILEFNDFNLILENSELFILKDLKKDFICSDSLDNSGKNVWGNSHEILIKKFYDSIIFKNNDYLSALSSLDLHNLVSNIYEKIKGGLNE